MRNLEESVTNADLEFIELGHDKAIMIPISEKLEEILSELAFSDDEANGMLRVKFAIYCYGSGNYYADLKLNELASENAGVDYDISNGFKLEDFAELIVWYEENLDLTDEDMERVIEIEAQALDSESQEDSEMPEEPEVLESEKDLETMGVVPNESYGNVEALFEGYDNAEQNEDAVGSVDILEELEESEVAEENSEVQEDKEDNPITSDTIENHLHKDELMETAIRLVETAEGTLLFPKFDDFTKTKLLSDVTNYQNNVNKAMSETVNKVYNRLKETEKRVENNDLAERLDNAKEEYQKALANIDIREKQTNDRLVKEIREKYEQDRQRFVDSVKPALETQYDKDHLESMYEVMRIKQEENRRFNENDREKQRAKYDKYVKNIKESGFREAVEALDIQDLLAPLDKEIDDGLRTLDEIAKKFNLGESEKVQDLESKVSNLSAENNALKESFDKRLSAEVSSEVADKTRKLQEENGRLVDDLNEERKRLFQANNNHSEADKLMKEEKKALVEKYERLQKELEDVKEKYEEAKKVQLAQMTNPMMAMPQMQQIQQPKKKNGVIGAICAMVVVAGLGTGGYLGLKHLENKIDTNSTQLREQTKEAKKEASLAKAEAKRLKVEAKESSSKSSSTSSSQSDSQAQTQATTPTETSSANQTVLSVDSHGAEVGKTFSYTLPNGKTVQILRTSQDAGQYTDDNGVTQKVFIRN